MSLTLGFSPCPNDTFIFDAWVNGRLADAQTCETALADVETLNEWSAEQKLDVTKLSFPALFRHLNTYRLLRAGSALGMGVGPLLIARESIDPNDASISEKRIVLPGRTTTANLLFSFAYPQAKYKSYQVFSEIEDAVLEGRADLGVIIHENRFTYQQRGLHCVMDLGAHWEKQTNCAVPLGCIAIKRSLGEVVAEQINGTIQQSLQYAWDRLPGLSDYVREHAQAMEESVMQQHIDLYVNKHTMCLEEADIHAIRTLYQVYLQVEGVNESEAPSLF
jgi:1,4-dihydroxy-6-naphthoate synthase